MMSQYQNMKFYTICRYKLKIKNSEIYQELKRLFGNYLDRTQEESVDKWIRDYKNEDVNTRENYFNYSRRNKYGFENLMFDIISNDEPNSIQKKRFYALCRFKFIQNQTQLIQEINELFYKDDIIVLNQWIIESYKLDSELNVSKPLKFIPNDFNLKDLQTKCINLLNEFQTLNQTLKMTQIEKENLVKQVRKHEEEIDLAKIYWEETNNKLIMEIDMLKQKNSKLDCDLYKLRNQLKENKHVELISKEHLDKIEQLNLKLNEFESKCFKLEEYNKVLKWRISKRTRRVSRLLVRDRIKLRGVYNAKFKYLSLQMDKQNENSEFILRQIRNEFDEKIYKLNEQLKCKSIVYSTEEALTLKQEQIKIEKYDMSFN